MIHLLLSEIAAHLNSGGQNYTVFLTLLCLQSDSGNSIITCIKKALGENTVIDNLRIVDKFEVANEVENSLRYVGYEGAGPSSTTLDSEEFKLLLRKLVEELEIASREAIRVWKFKIEEGHPAYPVFWDFAFLFERSESIHIFIGSSSD